jgi:antitoxin YafN
MSVLLGKKRVIMATQRILAEETISISEMRKHPTEYFTDHPIAVLNRNQTEGYMLGKALAEGSAQFLANAKEEDPGEFVE